MENPSYFGAGAPVPTSIVTQNLSTIDAASLAPHVSWGTNPGQVTALDTTVPDPQLTATIFDVAGNSLADWTILRSELE